MRHVLKIKNIFQIVYKRQRHLLKHFCTSYSKRHHRPLSMSVVPNPRNSYLSFTLQLVRSTYFQTRYVTYIIRHLTSTDTPRCKLRILRHATRPQIRPMEPPTSSSISTRLEPIFACILRSTTSSIVKYSPPFTIHTGGPLGSTEPYDETYE
jgi:hypothetical protein